MAVAESRWLRTGSEAAKQLTKRWAKGTAIFFAMGAVSGTVLAFELGLLWPGFIRHAGAVIGYPFSLEGFAFFAATHLCAEADDLGMREDFRRRAIGAGVAVFVVGWITWQVAARANTVLGAHLTGAWWAWPRACGGGESWWSGRARRRSCC